MILPAILIIAIIFYNFKPKSTNKTNVPPGSFGWPFIGETYEFLNKEPEKFLAERMKKYSPKIFRTKIFGEPTVVLCGVAGHKFLASNEASLFNLRHGDHVPCRNYSALPIKKLIQHSRLDNPRCISHVRQVLSGPKLLFATWKKWIL